MWICLMVVLSQLVSSGFCRKLIAFTLLKSRLSQRSSSLSWLLLNSICLCSQPIRTSSISQCYQAAITTTNCCRKNLYLSSQYYIMQWRHHANTMSHKHPFSANINFLKINLLTTLEALSLWVAMMFINYSISFTHCFFQVTSVYNPFPLIHIHIPIHIHMFII